MVQELLQRLLNASHCFESSTFRRTFWRSRRHWSLLYRAIDSISAHHQVWVLKNRGELVFVIFLSPSSSAGKKITPTATNTAAPTKRFWNLPCTLLFQSSITCATVWNEPQTTTISLRQHQTLLVAMYFQHYQIPLVFRCWVTHPQKHRNSLSGATLPAISHNGVGTLMFCNIFIAAYQPQCAPEYQIFCGNCDNFSAKYPAAWGLWATSKITKDVENRTENDPWCARYIPSTMLLC